MILVSVRQYRAEVGRVSREEEQEHVPMEPVDRYIKEDSQPAIAALVTREKGHKTDSVFRRLVLQPSPSTSYQPVRLLQLQTQKAQ